MAISVCSALWRAHHDKWRRSVALRNTLRATGRLQRLPLSIPGMSPSARNDLDAIDCRIVSALQADGRLTNIDLADSRPVASPWLRRVKRLDGNDTRGLSRVPHAIVSAGLFRFVGVKIDGHADERPLGLEKAVSPCPRSSLAISSRASDYLPRNRRPRSRPLPAISGRQALNLPIVREVRSNIAIQTVKANAPLPLRHLDAGPR